MSVMKPLGVPPGLSEGVPADVTNTGVLWKRMASWDIEGAPILRVLSREARNS